MLGVWDRGPHVTPIASDLGDSDGEYIRGISGYTHDRPHEERALLALGLGQLKRDQTFATPRVRRAR